MGALVTMADERGENRSPIPFYVALAKPNSQILSVHNGRSDFRDSVMSHWPIRTRRPFNSAVADPIPLIL